MGFSGENRQTYGRRALIRGAVAIPLALTVGCGDGAPPAPTNEPVTTKVPETPISVDAKKAQLITEFDRLPDSPIKLFLQERVSPIFSRKTPFDISYGNFQFPIRASGVEIVDSDEKKLFGEYYPQFYKDNPPTLKSSHEVKLRVPIVGDLVKDSEKERFLTFENGTPFFTLNIPLNTPVYEGLAPMIKVTRPRMGISPAVDKFNEDYTRFLLIKESSTLLLAGIVAEEMNTEMQNGLAPTKIEATSSDGTVRSIEPINLALDHMARLNQRVTVAIDLGGAAIAIKAVEGTIMLNNAVLGDPNLAYLANIMKQINLGSTTRELMKNTFLHMLSLPNLEQVLQKGGISGDVNKIP